MGSNLNSEILDSFAPALSASRVAHRCRGFPARYVREHGIGHSTLVRPVSLHLYLGSSRRARPLPRGPAAAGSLIPFAPLKLGRVPASSPLPSRLCLDRSHCPVLAPATLAALPSTRAIPDRDVFYVAFPKSSIHSRLWSAVR
jgi:hypothetical protein